MYNNYLYKRKSFGNLINFFFFPREKFLWLNPRAFRVFLTDVINCFIVHMDFENKSYFSSTINSKWAICTNVAHSSSSFSAVIVACSVPRSAVKTNGYL